MILLVIFVINRYPITKDNYLNKVSNDDKTSYWYNIKQMWFSPIAYFIWKDGDFIFLTIFVFAAFLGVFYK